jgi:PKHD-type hydroxylase
MKFDSIFYETKLPDEIVDLILRDIENTETTQAGVGQLNVKNNFYRNSNIGWIEFTHWISGFLWHYINIANLTNFRYVLYSYDKQKLQYTVYGNDQYYNWHLDYYPSADENEPVRKLSLSLQLSDEDEYEGGELQIIDDVNRSIYTVPKKKGSLVVFDSRLRHRVKKVKSGERKSLVAWVVGPKWK